MGIVKVFEEIFKTPKKEEVKEVQVVKEEVKIRPRELISLTRTVPPSTKITRFENYVEYPVKVLVVSVHLYFPPGCEDLVDVTLGAGSYIFAERIISGDGKGLSFVVNREVSPYTPIWAEITNYDTTYPHTITTELEIEKYI
jgi:hypothetical protein